MSSELNYLEISIGRQITAIEKDIRDLEEEKKALQRLLLKARQDNTQNKQVVRKNSVNRIMVENKIIDTLRQSSKPLSNHDLYNAAKIVVYNLKQPTFRSYIKRMKDAGSIEPKNGRWILPKQ